MLLKINISICDIFGYMSFENFSHYTEVRAHGLDSRKGVRSQV